MDICMCLQPERLPSHEIGVAEETHVCVEISQRAVITAA